MSPMWVAGPKNLEHLPLLSQAHLQRAGWKVVLQGLKLVSVGDVCVAGGNLTHNATALLPPCPAKGFCFCFKEAIRQVSSKDFLCSHLKASVLHLGCFCLFVFLLVVYISSLSEFCWSNHFPACSNPILWSC